MPKVALQDTQGKSVGEIEIQDHLFGVDPHVSVMHRKVLAELANARQGTSATLSRGEVQGGGKKPYRQKHTGRARQGSTRAPHWRKGGVVHGAQPRHYELGMNKKEKRLAIRSALSAKVADGSLIILQDLSLPEVKTKHAVELLAHLGVTKEKVLLILPQHDEATWKAFRNVPHVTVRFTPNFSVFDVLTAQKVVTTETAIRKMEEVWSV